MLVVDGIYYLRHRDQVHLLHTRRYILDVGHYEPERSAESARSVQAKARIACDLELVLLRFKCQAGVLLHLQGRSVLLI